MNFLNAFRAFSLLLLLLVFSNGVNAANKVSICLSGSDAAFQPMANPEIEALFCIVP